MIETGDVGLLSTRRSFCFPRRALRFVVRVPAFDSGNRFDHLFELEAVTPIFNLYFAHDARDDTINRVPVHLEKKAYHGGNDSIIRQDTFPFAHGIYFLM